MVEVIRCEGGPYSGDMNVDGTISNVIGIAVDESIRPVQTDQPFAIAMYELERRASEEVYVFKGFQRPDNQPFPVEFIDGPARGVHPAPLPAQYLGPEQQ